MPDVGSGCVMSTKSVLLLLRDSLGLVVGDSDGMVFSSFAELFILGALWEQASLASQGGSSKEYRALHATSCVHMMLVEFVNSCTGLCSVLASNAWVDTSRGSVSYDC